MTDKQSSTAQSYIDAAKGAAQSVLGSVTGSTADKIEGERKQEQARAENDLSHSAAKLGPVSISSSGAVAQDHPDRSAGSWNQTIGASKEAIGNLTGADGLRREGVEQNREGKAQEAHGQVSDFAGGLGDRSAGAIGATLAGLTGNRDEQERYQAQHDVGKTQQRGAEHDIQKQA